MHISLPHRVSVGHGQLLCKHIPYAMLYQYIYIFLISVYFILKAFYLLSQHLGNLKHLDLSVSHDLIELPDLSHASKLETINLNCCVSLRQLPKMPMNLKWLDMRSTAIKDFVESSLESLPNSGKLKSFEALNLTSFHAPKHLLKVQKLLSI